MEPSTTTPQEAIKHRPTSTRQMQLWLADVCSLHLPLAPTCPDHHTPLDYLLHVVNQPADKSPDCVVWACRGGGKTQLGAVATFLDALYHPNIQIRILGGSLDQSSRMFTYLKKLLLPFPDLLDGEPTHRRIRFTNGATVEILAQSHTAVRGTRVQKLRCDEVELFDPDVWQAAQLTTRSASKKDDAVRAAVEALSTMHAPGGLMARIVNDAPANHTPVFSWCVWDIIEKCPPERVCDTCPLFDACAGRAEHAGGFLHIDDLIAMRARVSTATWQHEMLCEKPTTSDSVFPEFHPPAHVAAFPTHGPAVAGRRCTWYVGIDFGFVGAFAAVYLALTDDPLPHVYVVDELVASSQRLPANIEALAARFAPQGPYPIPLAVCCDPAGNHPNSHTGTTDLSLLRNQGLHVRTRSAPIHVGIELIRSLLDPAAGRPRLTIHPRCHNLITALQSLRWNPRTNAPLKDNTHDHPIDALRYALTNILTPKHQTTTRAY